jgi:hypothetical protein
MHDQSQPIEGDKESIPGIIELRTLALKYNEAKVGLEDIEVGKRKHAQTT